MSAATALSPVVEVEPVRWPLRPLLEAARLNRRQLAEHLHTGGDTLRQAEALGLTDPQADRWAVRLGFHPAQVWGWEWFEAGHTPHRIATASYVAVAERLRARIESGELAPGDPVPSVVELAAAQRVGHSTAAKALQALTRDGLIHRRSNGHRAVVARLLDLDTAHRAFATDGPDGEGVGCDVCGEPIPAGAEHYPHESDCQAGRLGWCACHRPVHPECCPACPDVSEAPR